MSDESVAPPGVMDPCQIIVERMREMVHVGVFADATSAAAQAPAAVCLGNVSWDFEKQSFIIPEVADTDPRDDVRQRAGARANEIVAPEGRIQAHAEDAGPTTFQVKGVVQAVAADDGTLPVIQAPGGSLQFSPAIPSGSIAPAAANTMSLAYLSNMVTGNSLVLDLGNSDPHSQFTIEKHGTAGLGTGTPVAAITAAAGGTIVIANGAFTEVNSSANLVVGSGANTLSIASGASVGLDRRQRGQVSAAGFRRRPWRCDGLCRGRVAGGNDRRTHHYGQGKNVALGTIDTIAGLAGV